MGSRKRYAQVGLGGRAGMYTSAILETYAATSELAGVCDSNEGRARLAVEAARAKGVPVPAYAASEFDRMIRETRPDCVIVTTVDRWHDEFICRAMEQGCDAITEKPMTTDAAKCRRILDTQRRTGRSCTVTFNYRYAPPRTQVKDLLMSGVIGEVLSADFHWLLDVHHGADYFRRWHRRKENSGGLLVHKATHHFDLLNWWLGTVPETVYAQGHRRFYRPETADRFGLTRRTERCHTCPEGGRCRFRLALKDNAGLKRLYLDVESHDGYFRDRCVFSPDMDIEDSVCLVIGYASGVKASYSLNAFLPWEGYTIAFNGTRGRLEHTCQESVYINADGSVPGALKKDGTRIRIFPHWQPAYEVPVWTGIGGHGGGDSAMLAYVFDAAGQPPDKYLRAADQRAGAWSVLTGIAANLSLDERRPVRVEDLVPGVPLPDSPPMPTGAEPLG